jgi:hypothetical protein
MTTNDDERDAKPETNDEDTEGHGLLVDTDYYLTRKIRDADFEREMRDRQRLKEARPNKPNRG